VYTYTIYITLNYKRTPRTKVARTSCLANSLNISVGKTPVPNSGVPFAYPSIGKKPYYTGSLSLNGSIGPTSISL